MTLPPDIVNTSMHALIHSFFLAPVTIMYIESFVKVRPSATLPNYMMEIFLHFGLQFIKNRANKIIQCTLMIIAVITIMRLTLIEEGRMHIIDAMTAKAGIGTAGTATAKQTKRFMMYHKAGSSILQMVMDIAMRMRAASTTIRVLSTSCTYMLIRCSVGRRLLVAW